MTDLLTLPNIRNPHGGQSSYWACPNRQPRPTGSVLKAQGTVLNKTHRTSRWSGHSSGPFRSTHLHRRRTCSPSATVRLAAPGIHRSESSCNPVGPDIRPGPFEAHTSIEGRLVVHSHLFAWSHRAFIGAQVHVTEFSSP